MKQHINYKASFNPLFKLFLGITIFSLLLTLLLLLTGLLVNFNASVGEPVYNISTFVSTFAVDTGNSIFSGETRGLLILAENAGSYTNSIELLNTALSGVVFLIITILLIINTIIFLFIGNAVVHSKNIIKLTHRTKNSD